MANYELSNRIYELRTQKGFSQKELGAILGVSNKAVSKWETGTAIPKTETLIKLAEVFGVSTEEFLNMALPLQNAQPTNEIMINPVNARTGKTLSEFRAEYGLYLKDIAEKIGVSEEELQSVEDSNLVPNEIAEKLVIAYNLPENNFAKPIFKSRTVTKKHFLKISLIYQIIIAFIGAIPIAVGSMLVTLGSMLDSNAIKDAAFWVNDAYYIVSPVVKIVGCILLGKYLTEKTGYIGDFNRYKFLYAVVPSATAVSITALGNFIVGLIADYLRDTSDGFSSMVLTMIASAVSMIFSVFGMAVIVIVSAMLMNMVIEHSKERARMTFKKISIFVTISSMIAFVIEYFNTRLMWYEGDFHWTTAYSFDPIERFLPYAVSLAIMWLVYSIMTSNNNPKKEKWAFKILPIISICNVAIIVEIIGGLLGLLFEWLIEMLESLLPF